MTHYMTEKFHKAYMITACIIVVERFYALTQLKSLGAYVTFVAVLLALAAIETQLEAARKASQPARVKLKNR